MPVFTDLEVSVTQQQPGDRLKQHGEEVLSDVTHTAPPLDEARLAQCAAGEVAEGQKA